LIFKRRLSFGSDGMHIVDLHMHDMSVFNQTLQPLIQEWEECDNALKYLLAALTLVFRTFPEGKHDARSKTDTVLLFRKEWIVLIIEHFAWIAFFMLLLKSVLRRRRRESQEQSELLTDTEVIKAEKSFQMAEWVYNTAKKATQLKLKQLNDAIERTLHDDDESLNMQPYLAIKGGSGYPVMSLYIDSLELVSHYKVSIHDTTSKDRLWMLRRLEDRVSLIYGEALHLVYIGGSIEETSLMNLFLMSIYDEAIGYMNQAISVCDGEAGIVVELADLDMERLLLYELMATLYCDMARMLKHLHAHAEGIMRLQLVAQECRNHVEVIANKWTTAITENNASNKSQRVLCKCQLLHILLGIRCRGLFKLESIEMDSRDSSVYVIAQLWEHLTSLLASLEKSINEYYTMPTLSRVVSSSIQTSLRWIETALVFGSMEIVRLRRDYKPRVCKLVNVVYSKPNTPKIYIRWFNAIFKHHLSWVTGGNDMETVLVASRIASFLDEQSLCLCMTYCLNLLKPLVSEYTSRCFLCLAKAMMHIAQETKETTFQPAVNFSSSAF
jgi:hypothetical protein